jgi:hypothetical protein
MTGFSIRFVNENFYRCVRCGYAWCRIVAASLRACVPAHAPVSSVPVPDADTLDMDKTRAGLDVRACTRARYMQGRGTPMGGCVAAQALYKT